MANITTVTFNYALDWLQDSILLFVLNVGVSPCFHCTGLVSAYRVYTSYINNTVVMFLKKVEMIHFSVLFRDVIFYVFGSKSNLN